MRSAAWCIYLAHILFVHVESKFVCAEDCARLSNVQETLRTRGLRDDTTCIVVDLLPPTYVEPPPPVIKKKSTIYRMFHWKQKQPPPSQPAYDEIPVMEELFEEGSAMLSERLVKNLILAFVRNISFTRFVLF